jgi:hypothetical protein
MYFAFVYFEVDSPENFFAVDTGVQVFNLE